MKNLEVKKKINNKMKLCRISMVGAYTVSASAPVLSSATISLFINGGMLPSFFYLPGVVVGGIVVSNVINHISIPLIKSANSETKPNIELLKRLKRELSYGINRFKNISEENFEDQFEKCKKRLY